MIGTACNLDWICIYLEARGYHAQLMKHDHGFASISSGSDGERFKIYAHYEDSADEYSNIRFSLFRNSDDCDLSVGQINKLNSKLLISNAYKDDDGDVNIRASLFVTEQEMTENIFENAFMPWLSDVGAYAKVTA